MCVKSCVADTPDWPSNAGLVLNRIARKITRIVCVCVCVRVRVRVCVFVSVFKTQHPHGSFNDWLKNLSPEDITRAIMSSQKVLILSRFSRSLLCLLEPPGARSVFVSSAYVSHSSEDQHNVTRMQ